MRRSLLLLLIRHALEFVVGDKLRTPSIRGQLRQVDGLVAVLRYAVRPVRNPILVDVVVLNVVVLRGIGATGVVVGGGIVPVLVGFERLRSRILQLPLLQLLLYLINHFILLRHLHEHLLFFSFAHVFFV